MRVLIAEDNAVPRRVLEATLSKWGYDVISCSDGTQAWERLKSEQPPELAVLDWMMPGLDGPELCRRVRKSADPTSTYIILLTSRDGSDDIIEGLDAGADDYVRKPFDPQDLRARIGVGERIVELQRRRLKQETEHYIEQLEQTVGELQQSRRRIVLAQEEAGKSIAQQLHGPVQSKLLMLCLRLDEIRDRLETSPEEARKELQQVTDDLDKFREDEIRQISHRLHPSIVTAGLRAGIKSLRDHYERSISIGVAISQEVAELESDGGSGIPFDVRLCLYRVADEALTNVLKHAGDSHVDIALELSDRQDTISLTVRDDGPGFELENRPRGLGTVTMEDHLGAIGGSLRLDTAPGKGTRITATVPLEMEAARPHGD